MALASGRTFFKILVFWIFIYILSLYTFVKPDLTLDTSYLLSYKLEDAPLWTNEEALRINQDSCPPNDVNFDRAAVSSNEQKWDTMTVNDVYSLREGMLKYLETATHEGKTTGKGIVMSAGDSAALQRAGVSLSLLRSHGCQLPVQIYHYEDEADKIDPMMIESLSVLGADVIELGGVKRGAAWKAFQIKAIAIQRCSFDEILYLDTDSYLARDPTYLFDAPSYRVTGAMLWPDFTKSHPTNPIWRILGIPCRPQFEAESGQILFNRAHHQKTMHLAEHLALEQDKFYHMTGGDRDSFRVALMALGKSWAGPTRMLAVAGIGRRYGGHTMVQSDHLGDWLFVHANLLKHSSLPRDSPETWKKLTHIVNDTFFGDLGYGSLLGNERVGDGVMLDVLNGSSMFTEYIPFTPIEDAAAEADWRKQHLIEESFNVTGGVLSGFEGKFFKYGGKRM